MKRAMMAFALSAASISLPATSVLADPPPGAHNNKKPKSQKGGSKQKGKDRMSQNRQPQGGKQSGRTMNSRGSKARGARIYDDRGRYVTPHRIRRRSEMWRGNDGRYYCRRDDGSTGLVVGAGLGALLGNQASGNGDKTLGTILGGVLGGLIGREIDKGDLQCH